MALMKRGPFPVDDSWAQHRSQSIGDELSERATFTRDAVPQ